CSLQLEHGGFKGGVMIKSREATIFNTGQVILGLLRAYKEFKKDLYLNSAIKAGIFLEKTQEKNGNWVKYCFNNVPHTYNTRVAWALLELFQLTKKEIFRKVAINNLNWAIKQVNENYWFTNNAFILNRNPLLHTISYAIRGFLESGIILENEKYKTIALKSSLELLNIFERDHFLPATFDSNWHSNDYYSCLTGNAQLAIIWFKLFQIYQNNRFLVNAVKLNNYLKQNQILNHKFKEIDGAIKGSDPIWGKYNPFRFPNWATKFFCDSMMLEIKIQSKIY
ncbi:MAG: hypothetical protein ACFFAO_11205, partial [Candidatus Hermodarchaeota archaeon]